MLNRTGRIVRKRRIRPLSRARERELGDLERSRAIVLKRARGRCERCHSKAPLEIHHLVPRSRGRGWPCLHWPSNLAALCLQCHRAIHEHRVPHLEHWLRSAPGDAQRAADDSQPRCVCRSASGATSPQALSQGLPGPLAGPSGPKLAAGDAGSAQVQWLGSSEVSTRGFHPEADRG